jgi:hypothetical protein
MLVRQIPKTYYRTTTDAVRKYPLSGRQVVCLNPVIEGFFIPWPLNKTPGCWPMFETRIGLATKLALHRPIKPTIARPRKQDIAASGMIEFP